MKMSHYEQAAIDQAKIGGNVERAKVDALLAIADYLRAMVDRQQDIFSELCSIRQNIGMMGERGDD
jgi:hypothetical protein